MTYVYFMSSFYRTVRHILFVLLVLLFIAPVIWTIIKQQNDKKYFSEFIKSMGHFPVNLTFNNLNYITSDDKNNIISVSSPEGTADDLETHNLFLKEPRIHVISDDKPLFIEAQTGQFNGQEKNIIFENNVHIKDENGSNTAQTNLVTFDIKNGILDIPQNVNATLENGNVHAGSVSASQSDKKIYFSDGIKMIINP